MIEFLLSLFFALLWPLPEARSVVWIEAAPAGGGTNFANDAECRGIFLLTDSTTSGSCTNCLDNNCADGLPLLNGGGQTPALLNNPTEGLPPNVTTSSIYYAADSVVASGDEWFSTDSTFAPATFSVCGWFYDQKATQHFFVSNYAATDGWALGRDDTTTDDRTIMRLDTTFVDTTSEPANNAWVHSCFTYDSADSGWVHYTNGEADGSGTQAFTYTNHAFKIADNGGGLGTWDGLIFEVGVFGKELTADEVCQICRCGVRDEFADRTTSCGTTCGNDGDISCTN